MGAGGLMLHTGLASKRWRARQLFSRIKDAQTVKSAARRTCSRFEPTCAQSGQIPVTKHKAEAR